MNTTLESSSQHNFEKSWKKEEKSKTLIQMKRNSEEPQAYGEFLYCRLKSISSTRQVIWKFWLFVSFYSGQISQNYLVQMIKCSNVIDPILPTDIFIREYNFLCTRVHEYNFFPKCGILLLKFCFDVWNVCILRLSSASFVMIFRTELTR